MRVCNAWERRVDAGSALAREKRSSKAASDPRPSANATTVIVREELCGTSAAVSNNSNGKEIAANPAIRPAAPLNICKEPLLKCGSGRIMVNSLSALF